MLFATLLLSASVGSTAEAGCFPATFKDELIERSAKDQSARRAFIDGGMKRGEDKVILEIDLSNTSWLREIVKRCGWPAQSIVGEDGALSAWLIAQHADATPDFQIEAARAMEPRVREGEASGERLALLVDRHARLQRIPQSYGMQYNMVEGRIQFLPVREPAQLDERRSRVGLPSFACYLASVEQQRQAMADWPDGVERKACESP